MSDRYAKYEGHTKGPWSKSERDPFGDYTIQGPEGGLAIASVCNGHMRMMGGQGLEHDANAALIADATTLLAENKRMREALTEAQSVLANLLDTTPGRPSVHIVFAQCVAAEAKARAALNGDTK